jgi:hypothetical protein
MSDLRRDMTAATIHHLKTWPDPFEAVWQGRKRAEFRKADRNFRVGDILHLMEFDPDKRPHFPGRWVRAEITDVRLGGPFGIPEGYAMLSMDVYDRGTEGAGI